MSRPRYALLQAAAAGSRWALGPQPSPPARGAAGGGVRPGGRGENGFWISYTSAEFITLDYAGFRTFDAVVRAKAVFGQAALMVVSIATRAVPLTFMDMRPRLIAIV